MLAALRTAIGVGLLVYLGTLGAINWSALLGLAEAWPLSLTVLALLVMTVVLTSWRLCVLLKPHGLHLSLASSLRLTLIGAFFNACLPGITGGDIVRVYYATVGNRSGFTEIATVMLLDRAVGAFALALWPLLAAPLFPRLLESVGILLVLLWAAAAVVAAMLAGVLFCFARQERNSRPMSRAFPRLRLVAHAERVFKTVGAYRRNVGILLAAVGISLLVQTITVGVMLLLVQATSPTGVSGPMVILIPLGFMANALPVTPGGLGVGEAAFIKLFQLAGLTGGAEALLGWRVLTTFVDLLGLVFYLQGGKPSVDRG
ncbi:MAG TPA: lysylphosphatidylglycerol synthase transmembrane domain-containing protein [Candidatus Binatia bacterium]